MKDIISGARWCSEQMVITNKLISIYWIKMLPFLSNLFNMKPFMLRQLNWKLDFF